MYSSYVWSATLHASKTWPLTKPNLQCLQRNDRAMIRQICNIKPKDIVTIRSNELFRWLGIQDLDLILKERRLHWYGHAEPFFQAVFTCVQMPSPGLQKPCSLLLAARYFSCSCLTTKMTSVVPLPWTKSNWELLIDTNCLMRPSTILCRTYMTCSVSLRLR